MIIDQLKLNVQLPIHEDYADTMQATDFWWRSYELKRKYLWGSDAVGNEIIMQHSCESKEDYKKRLAVTKPRAYLPQIINQYNSYVFGGEIVRNGVPDILIEDANGDGESLDELMAEATVKAQVKGAHILIPTYTGPVGETLSIAQAQAEGVRPIILSYDIECLVNWGDKEAIIKLSDEWARYYNDEYYVDIGLRKNNRNSIIIDTIEEPVYHKYGKVPLSLIKPKLWSESQAAKLADICQTIFNYQSLLNTELYNKTFSHLVLSGDFDSEEVENVQFGTGKATILQTNGGVTPSMEVMGGSDVAQADSIRQSLADEINALYKTAALSQVQSSDAIDTQSAISKQVNMQGTIAFVKSIANACEASENRLWSLFGFEGAESDYSQAYSEMEVEEGDEDGVESRPEEEDPAES